MEEKERELWRVARSGSTVDEFAAAVGGVGLLGRVLLLLLVASSFGKEEALTCKSQAHEL